MLLASKGSRVGWVCRVWAMGRKRKKAQEVEKWQNIPRRQGEISNALIKQLHASCAKKGSKCIFLSSSDEMREKRRKSLAPKHRGGTVHNWHFIFDKTNVRRASMRPPNVLERSFGAAHHLRSRLNFSCSRKSEYKIILGNFYCNLTLSFMFVFLISQKCLWSLQINFISPLTKRASAE